MTYTVLSGTLNSTIPYHTSFYMMVLIWSYFSGCFGFQPVACTPSPCQGSSWLFPLCSFSWRKLLSTTALWCVQEKPFHWKCSVFIWSWVMYLVMKYYKRNPFTESVECSYEVGNVSGNEVLYSATSWCRFRQCRVQSLQYFVMLAKSCSGSVIHQL